MKYVKAMYATMAIIIFVILVSEYVLNSAYSAIAAWICTMLFLLGTIFFVNARYYLRKEDRS
ncbi:hypothetical protein PZE06_25300 [Robertmurraya sp. DFI.2.37]|jgi:dolichyl-phosphate-mannose--protein O-mannosyl transferase|uniref:hypothetical protein n=1 Tax=Robertmurraya sp. DFI.2.37 TaxID=3031819 RepID=UPI00124401DB|nr:hypothetical protein [Robertmurraya sp. DFI.2.37]MDF1511423.1 hypothetical protein [Robertmurraya sp. DFI.2.37]